MSARGEQQQQDLKLQQKQEGKQPQTQPQRPPPSRRKQVSASSGTTTTTVTSTTTSVATNSRRTLPIYGPNPPPSGGSPQRSTEAEALMSMFVELMGLEKAPVFMLGEPPEEIAAAAAAAMYGMQPPPEWMDYYDDQEDDDDDSIPREDDKDDPMPELTEINSAPSARPEGVTPAPPQNAKSPAPEQPEVQKEKNKNEEEENSEDAFKKSKASKKKEKKNRRKEKAKQDAAIKAAQTAEKKRHKALLSWKTRVVSACVSGEGPLGVTKLEGILKESPLLRNGNAPDEDATIAALEWLMPNCVSSKTSNIVARCKLASFIVSIDSSVLFACNPRQSGRNIMQLACLQGDAGFLKWLLEGNVGDQEDTDLSFQDLRQEAQTHINDCCKESGWSPLHYAAAMGNTKMVESLLAAGCQYDQCTQVDLTTCASDGKGITAKELANLILSNDGKNISCHGDALERVLDVRLKNVRSEEKIRFHRSLDKIITRLSHVEKHGYSPLTTGDEEQQESSPPKETNSGTNNEETAKKKKKKKKRQAVAAAAAAEAPPPAPAPAPTPVAQEDPVMTALLGMGFSSEQILKAAHACGGIEKATADDVVAKIFEIESGVVSTTPKQEVVAPPAPPKKQQEFSLSSSMSKAQQSNIEDGPLSQMVAAAKREEEAALAAQRLATKREEQRRKNREWNNREQNRQLAEARQRAAQERERQKQVEAAAAARARAEAEQQQARMMASAYAIPRGSSGAPNVSATMTVPKHILGRNGELHQVNGVPRAERGYQTAGNIQGSLQVPSTVVTPASTSTSSSGSSMSRGRGKANPPPGTGGNSRTYGGASQQPMQQQQQQHQQQPNPTQAASFSPDAKKNRQKGKKGKQQQQPPLPAKAGQLTVEGNANSDSSPPPGFWSVPNASTPSTASLSVNSGDVPSSLVEEPNRMGEIRATAKVFVPSNFKPAPSPLPPSAPAPTSAAPTPTSLSGTSTFPAEDYSLLSLGGIPPSSSFGLGTNNAAAPAPIGQAGSLLGSSSANLPASYQTYDRAPLSTTPLQSPQLPSHSPVPSVNSAMTAGSAGQNPPLLPIDHDSNTSSLLDSISMAAITTTGSDIWGGSASATLTSTTTTSTTTTTSLARLPSLFSGSDATTDGGGDGQKSSTTSTWGNPGRGSIW